MKGVQCYELFGGIALKIHTEEDVVFKSNNDPVNNISTLVGELVDAIYKTVQ